MFGSNPFASAPFGGLTQQDITGTLSVTLDDVAIGFTGVVEHEGTLSLTTDDIVFSATGADQHTGALNLVLDNVIVTMSGVDAHNGYLSLNLDDAEFNANGNVEHTGTLALVLDDVIIEMHGAGSETGTLSLVTDDVTIAFNGQVIPHDVQVTRGGYFKKKNYKNQHTEIEQTIQKIIDGEPEPEIVEEVKQPEEIDFSPFISELIAEAQAEAFNLTLQEYMRLEAEAEADDEETLLMIL